MLDFDVRKSLAPRKSAENDEKPKNKSEFFSKKKKKIGVKKSKFANRLKRALPKFRGDRSQVRRVNGRSKFVAASAGRAERKQFTSPWLRSWVRRSHRPRDRESFYLRRSRNAEAAIAKRRGGDRRRRRRRASRRGGDRESFRESFRENSSKNLILQIFRTRRTHGDIENYY